MATSLEYHWNPLIQKANRDRKLNYRRGLPCVLTLLSHFWAVDLEHDRVEKGTIAVAAVRLL